MTRASRARSSAARLSLSLQGSNAMTRAAQNGHTEVVRALLEANASVDAGDKVRDARGEARAASYATAYYGVYRRGE
eukprot:1861294-Prymnesium_polylepis.1